MCRAGDGVHHVEVLTGSEMERFIELGDVRVGAAIAPDVAQLLLLCACCRTSAQATRRLESTGVDKVVSFDRSIDRIDTIERIERPRV